MGRNIKALHIDIWSYYPWGLVQLVADCSCKLGERYSDTPGSKEVTGSIIRLWKTFYEEGSYPRALGPGVVVPPDHHFLTKKYFFLYENPKENAKDAPKWTERP